MNDSYQHPGKWQDVTLVPTMGRSEANHFVMSHIVRGLERNSVYEAIIHAKNRYGWNEVSPLAHTLLPYHRITTTNTATIKRSETAAAGLQAIRVP